MKIYGYGEDALTLWALSDRSEEVLRQLADASRPDETIMIYRPSFGRGGNGQFGEFDAILGTAKAIYLIEAKWTHSSDIRKNGAVELRAVQTARHQEFLSRFEQWCGTPEKGLEAFTEKDGLVLISSGSRLANNMHHVFNLLGVGDRPLVDVLLYLRLAGDTKQLSGLPAGFRLVDIHCGGKGFVELGARLPEGDAETA